MSEQTGSFTSLRALQEENDRLLDLQEAADTPAPTALWDEIEAFIARVQTTGALLDVPNERRAAQSILDYWDNALYRAGRSASNARLAEFDLNLAPDLAGVPCPYRGLAAFGEEDAPYFFGRRALIERLVNRLEQGARLLVVAGPSGSGKSSVVRAGVVRRLKQDGALPDSRSWRYVSMVPGAEPITNLDRALQADTPAPMRPIVLVVDQFEEVFTVCADPEARQAFEARLLELLETPEPRHIVILTLRDDFVPNLSQLTRLYTLYRDLDARVDVEPLDVNELREVIEGPAAIAGLKFEEGVVDDLVSKVLGEKAGLPLLQFTLLQLWEQRKRNRVTKEVYETVGSPLEALQRSADSFFATLLPEDQTRARRVLLAMVHPGEGKEYTSNRIPLEDIFTGDQSPERVEEVVYRLICEPRLVKLTGAPSDICAIEFRPGALRELAAAERARGNVIQIEVAHEALVRNWKQLGDWLDEERKTLQERWDFRRRVARWNDDGRRSEWLMRGAPLAAAASYVDLSPVERDFVVACQRLERRDRIFKAASIAALAGLAVLLFLAVGLLWQVERLRFLQLQVRSYAAEVFLATDGMPVEEKLGWALRAHVEDERVGQRPATRLVEELSLDAESDGTSASESLHPDAALRTALAGAPAHIFNRFYDAAPEAEVAEIIASPNGGMIATVSRTNQAPDPVILLWDTTAGAYRARLEPPLAADPTSEGVLAFSDDGALIAGVGPENTVYVWDTADGSPIARLEHDEPYITRVWPGPPGSALLATLSYADGGMAHVNIWDMAGGPPVLSLPGDFGLHAAFSPDGRWLAAQLAPSTLALQELPAKGQTPPEPLQLDLPATYVNDLTACPAGPAPCFYAALDDGQLYVCTQEGCSSAAEPAPESAELSELPFDLAASTAITEPAAVPPLDEPSGSRGGDIPGLSGPWLYLGPAGCPRLAVSDGATIQWWDVGTPDQPMLLNSIAAPSDHRHQPVFGPDCRTLTIVDDQQQVQAWDMDSAGLLSSDALPVQETEVLRLIQTADGAQVAGADTDRWVHLWRPDTISDAQRLDELRDWRAVSLSSDGRWLATLEDDAVALREMITGESRQLPLVVLPDGTDLSASSDVLIGPEARHVLVETFDGVVHVLDGVTGQELHYITDGPPVATWGISRDRLAASFPDGLVRLWDLTVFADLAVVEPITFTGPISNVLGLSLSADGQRLAVTGDSGAIEVWDLAQERRLLALPAPSEASGFVITGGGTALNDDGSLLAVAEPPSSEADGAVGQIAIWDVDAERRISVIPQSNLAPILAFDSVDADGPGLIIGAGDTLRLDLYRRALSSGELALKAAEVAGCQLDPSLSDSADRRVLESLPDCLKLLLPDDAAAEP